MKGIYNIALVLAAAITLTLSSCNPATELTATPDEIPVVATADEAQTEPTTIIEEITVAETTVAETTVPETTAEVTEPTKAEEPEKTENKPVNNSSSSSATSNKPSNSSSQTTNKPSNITSSGSNSSGSSTNKKPAETKPAEQKPVVVTDDTPLTYDEFVNDKNIQRLCDDVNAYFIAKGMKYTPSLNKDNSGWFYGYNSASNVTAVRSYNQQKARTITCLDEQVEAVLINMYGGSYDDIRFNCYYEVTPQGYYDIYFAYC